MNSYNFPNSNLNCNGNGGSDHILKIENSQPAISRHCVESNGRSIILKNRHPEIKEHYVRKRKGIRGLKRKYLELDSTDEKEDIDFVIANGEEKDDETTWLEEEELAKSEHDDSVDEVNKFG